MKKFCVLFLLLALVFTLFAGCSNTETPAPSQTPSSGNNGGKTTPPPSNTPDPGEDEDEEPVTIEFWLADSAYIGLNGTKADLVNQAISDYAEEQIGVRVHLNWIQAADYPTQLTLAIANQETIDLAMFTPPAMQFGVIYNKDFASDITDLMNEYGQDILGTLGDYIKATSPGGRIYGVPTYRLLNMNQYLVMRKDILDELGMTALAENPASWDDVESIFAAFKAADYDFYAFGGGFSSGLGGDRPYYVGQQMGKIKAFDTLGDTNNIVFTDDNGNVSILTELPEWVNGAKRIRSWFDAGYIHPDVYTETKGERELLANNTIFGFFIISEFGVESSVLQQSGYEAVCNQLTAGVVDTAACVKFGLFVPVTATEPAAAVRFMNLLYTDANLVNLIVWGVEGETYVVNDKGEACYPEGTEAATCGYHGQDFKWGSQFLAMPWDGQGSDWRVRSEANFLSASPSKYLGFLADLTEYDTLTVAMATVKAEYLIQLCSGNYSDELYDEYIQKLKATGVDDYIGVFQQQLSDFMG